MPESCEESIGEVAVVRDYDEALDFYVGTLGFTLVEDTYIPEQDKRWVVVAPPGSSESRLLLARAVGEEQSSRIGNQTGGRVFLFLHTDDFRRDFRSYRAKGVVFAREPKEESYGTVAVFTAPLPPTGDLPVVSASADESPSSGVANSSRGEDGKVIAWGLLLNITEQ
jgi:catechol 2,3-dioxygenase-like lactoylglutathione lyase family enzyme